jgi:hypothetical protein
MAWERFLQRFYNNNCRIALQLVWVSSRVRDERMDELQ